MANRQQRLPHHFLRLASFCAAAVLVLIPGCEQPRATDLTRLDEMETIDLTAKDHTFRCWIATTDEERMTGLMYVTAEQMADLPDGTHRGMLFVFPSDNPPWQGFYMKNTIIPLDIAFVEASGEVVSIRTMAPHDLSTTTPSGPYRCAIEVNANLFGQIGLEAGDTIEIPQAVLNTAQ